MCKGYDSDCDVQYARPNWGSEDKKKKHHKLESLK